MEQTADETGLVVITGGAGLIGSTIAHHLTAERPWLPLAIVEAPSRDGRLLNLSGVPIAEYWGRDEFLARIASGGRLPRLRAVIHMGACSSTTETNAEFLMRNNFGYTRDIAQYCLREKLRLVYASSAATYGAGACGYEDDPSVLPKLRPLNVYGFSKHAFDMWALRAGAFSTPGGITGLKYFNVYGPGEQHKAEMRSMVLKAYEQIEAGGAVQLFRSYRPDFADGEQRRDFLHAKDAAAVAGWFLDHPEATGIYNVGSGADRTWNDLARATFAALGRPPQIVYVPMPERIRGSYQYRTRADLRRLRAAGCQLSFRSLEDGVADYVQELIRAKG